MGRRFLHSFLLLCPIEIVPFAFGNVLEAEYKEGGGSIWASCRHGLCPGWHLLWALAVLGYHLCPVAPGATCTPCEVVAVP
jgi:hypothetical protein